MKRDYIKFPIVCMVYGQRMTWINSHGDAKLRYA
jgi:hypothetical protein